MSSVCTVSNFNKEELVVYYRSSKVRSMAPIWTNKEVRIEHNKPNVFFFTYGTIK